MSEKECTSCKKLQEIMAVGVKAPIWFCYDCGERIQPKEVVESEQ